MPQVHGSVGGADDFGAGVDALAGREAEAGSGDERHTACGAEDVMRNRSSSNKGARGRRKSGAFAGALELLAPPPPPTLRRAVMAASCSGSTRSHLFSRMRSANATCSTACARGCRRRRGR